MKNNSPTIMTPEQAVELNETNKRFKQISIGPVILPNHKQDIVFLDKGPEKCPFCFQKTPVFKSFRNDQFFEKSDFYEGRLLINFYCSNEKCRASCLAEYEGSKKHKVYLFKRVYPAAFEKKYFPEDINKISPSFCEIYNQALKSEMENLNQICGMGYRKALEFLIKDYLIRKNPNKADEIKKLLLGDCIKKYIENPNIKTCAERTAWLGNDETHYDKKWKEKDLKDLKILLELTVNYIDSEIKTQKYLKAMPAKK